MSRLPHLLHPTTSKESVGHSVRSELVEAGVALFGLFREFWIDFFQVAYNGFRAFVQTVYVVIDNNKS